MLERPSMGYRQYTLFQRLLHKLVRQPALTVVLISTNRQTNRRHPTLYPLFIEL